MPTPLLWVNTCVSAANGDPAPLIVLHGNTGGAWNVTLGPSAVQTSRARPVRNTLNTLTQYQCCGYAEEDDVHILGVWSMMS